MRRAVLFLSLIAALPALAQPQCDASFPQIKPRGATIFSPEQEGYLGDAVAEQMRRRLLVYERPELTAPLDASAAR